MTRRGEKIATICRRGVKKTRFFDEFLNVGGGILTVIWRCRNDSAEGASQGVGVRKEPLGRGNGNPYTGEFSCVDISLETRVTGKQAPVFGRGRIISDY